MTRRRSLGVNNRFLAEVAIEMDLGKYMFLGKGELKQSGSENPKTLANCIEAIIGAIYLDSNLIKVRDFIIKKLYSKEFEF